MIPNLHIDDTEQENSTELGALISDNFDVELDSQCMQRNIDEESRTLGLEIIGRYANRVLLSFKAES